MSPGASTHREAFPCLATFRPQVLSTSRRFSPHPASRVYFIPQPRSGHLTVQGLLSPRSCPLSRVDLAPLPLPPAPLVDRDRRPRCASLGFEAFSPGEAAFLGAGDQPARRSLPSSVLGLLQVLSSPADGPVPRVDPLMASPRGDCAPRDHLQRVVSERIGSPVSGLPTCSRFRAVLRVPFLSSRSASARLFALPT